MNGIYAYIYQNQPFMSVNIPHMDPMGIGSQVGLFIRELPSHVEMGETLRSSNETSGGSRGSWNPGGVASGL